MMTISASTATVMLAVAGLCGCASELAPDSFEGTSPALHPEAFFAGKTSSSGVMENRSGAPTRRLRVEGVGSILPDGRLRLDQSVTFDQNKAETRTWVLTRLDAHHYSATLTDASGPFEAEAYGDLFHLRYPMKALPGGQVEQWMYLQPDGRTVMNVATVQVFGVVVARISERITHEDR